LLVEILNREGGHANSLSGSSRQGPSSEITVNARAKAHQSTSVLYTVVRFLRGGRRTVRRLTQEQVPYGTGLSALFAALLFVLVVVAVLLLALAFLALLALAFLALLTLAFLALLALAFLALLALAFLALLTLAFLLSLFAVVHDRFLECRRSPTGIAQQSLCHYRNWPLPGMKGRCRCAFV
jgi:hypothetical protein